VFVGFEVAIELVKVLLRDSRTASQFVGGDVLADEVGKWTVVRGLARP
jgi:hypothetical protein